MIIWQIYYLQSTDKQSVFHQHADTVRLCKYEALGTVRVKHVENSYASNYNIQTDQPYHKPFA